MKTRKHLTVQQETSRLKFNELLECPVLPLRVSSPLRGTEVGPSHSEYCCSDVAASMCWNAGDALGCRNGDKLDRVGGECGKGSRW